MYSTSRLRKRRSGWQPRPKIEPKTRTRRLFELDRHGARADAERARRPRGQARVGDTMVAIYERESIGMGIAPLGWRRRFVGVPTLEPPAHGPVSV
jgi:hypothetical protein